MLLQKLFDINPKDNFISKEDVYEKILLKLYKRLKEHEQPRFKYYSTEFEKINCTDNKYLMTDIITFMETFLYLPVHYTYIKELNLVNNNFEYIRKKFEYQSGYYLYKEFILNDDKYIILHQYQIYMYKIDYVIHLKETNIMIGIEIDEKHHKYLDDTERDTCIELNGIPLIRIKVDKLKHYTDINKTFMDPYIKQIKYKIQEEKNKQKIFDDKLLLDEAKKDLIEEDFAKITGLSIINDEQFIIPGDYIKNYIEYKHKISTFIDNCVIDNLIENIDYIKISKEQYEKLVVQNIVPQNIYTIISKDRRKYYYLFNTKGMLLAIINSNTEKAKDVKNKILKMYRITRKILHNKLIENEKYNQQKTGKIKYITDMLQFYKYNHKLQHENSQLKAELENFKKTDTNKILLENKTLKNEITNLQNELLIIKKKNIVQSSLNIKDEIIENLKQNFYDETGFKIIHDEQCIIPLEPILKYINYSKDRGYSFIKYNVISKLTIDKDYNKLSRHAYIKYKEDALYGKEFYFISRYNTLGQDFYLFNVKALISCIINSKTSKAIEIKNRFLGNKTDEVLTDDIITGERNNILQLKDLKLKNIQLASKICQLTKYIDNIKKEKNFIENFNEFEQNLHYVINKYPSKLKQEFEKYKISIELYDILAKLLLNNQDNNEYNIHIDDVVKYIEISCNQHLLRNIKKFELTNTHYLQFDSFKNFELYVNNNSKKTQQMYKHIIKKYHSSSNNRRQHILFNKHGFFELCNKTGTKKAEQTRLWFVKINDIILQMKN